MMWKNLLPLVILAVPGAWASADEPIRIQEQFPADYQYHVSTRVDLSGSLSLPLEKGQTTAKTLAVTGSSAIEYDERVLAVRGAEVEKTARIYAVWTFTAKWATARSRILCGWLSAGWCCSA